MKIEHRPINFSDDRGTITDIFTDSPKSHGTIITSKTGAVRGNHLHKLSTQYTYIIAGSYTGYSQTPGQPVAKYHLVAGDFITHLPSEAHVFVAEEDSSFLALVDGVRGGENYETDTYRLDVPVQELYAKQSLQ